MHVSIRRATRDDADAIAGLAVELVEQHVGYDPVRFSRIGDRGGMADYYRSRTGAENAAVLVAEQAGTVIGFAYLEYEPILYAELAVNVAWLHDIYVVAEARSTGAGRILIKAIAAESRRLGAAKLLLSVAAKNTAGQTFFERYGFRNTMFEMMLELDKDEV
jgi:GNAT superfamily N-acetyltransferase